MRVQKWYNILQLAGIGLVLFLCINAESLAELICR